MTNCMTKSYDGTKISVSLEFPSEFAIMLFIYPTKLTKLLLLSYHNDIHETFSLSQPGCRLWKFLKIFLWSSFHCGLFLQKQFFCFRGGTVWWMCVHLNNNLMVYMTRLLVLENVFNIITLLITVVTFLTRLSSHIKFPHGICYQLLCILYQDSIQFL